MRERKRVRVREKERQSVREKERLGVREREDRTCRGGKMDPMCTTMSLDQSIMGPLHRQSFLVCNVPVCKRGQCLDSKSSAAGR